MDFDKIANAVGSRVVSPGRRKEYHGVVQGYRVEWSKATLTERIARTTLGEWIGMKESLIDRYREVLTECLMDEYRMVYPNKSALCDGEVLWAVCEKKLSEVCGGKIETLEPITEKERSSILVLVDKLVGSRQVDSGASAVTTQLDKVISDFKTSKELMTGAQMKVDLYAVAYDYLKDHLDEKAFEALVEASTPKRVANEEMFLEFCKDTNNGVDDVEERVLRKWFRGHLIVGLDALEKSKLLEILVRMRGQ